MLPNCWISEFSYLVFEGLGSVENHICSSLDCLLFRDTQLGPEDSSVSSACRQTLMLSSEARLRG